MDEGLASYRTKFSCLRRHSKIGGFSNDSSAAPNLSLFLASWAVLQASTSIVRAAKDLEPDPATADHSTSTSTSTSTTAPPQECNTTTTTTIIPSSFDALFGSYPNILNITDEDRAQFHPVIVYPKHIADNMPLPVGTIERHKEWPLSHKYDEPNDARLSEYSVGGPNEPLLDYGTSCYYQEKNQSDLFDDTENTIDGYGGRRTVHLGIDLSGPVGTPVHAFADGIVHSVGYNHHHGDYGYVIVVEHYWNSTTSSSDTTTRRRVWALYGHLDKSTVQRKQSCQPGLKVEKGQVIGRLGDIYENGGWNAPHVHFQLSVRPPDQPHDMPGASSVQDRPTALLQYPDPRYVLGPLY